MTEQRDRAIHGAGFYCVRPDNTSERLFRKVHRLEPGTIIGGKYRIVSVIGEGGMGVVYEAEHVELGMRVAIKVLHPSEADAPETIARFRAEARLSAAIRHPNVVEVTDFGLTPDRRPFFVMVRLDGESLAEMMHRRAPLPSREVVEILDQILGGLLAAHAHGVVHRDLKPENVFLSRQHTGGTQVKLLDFGVARILSAEFAPERTAPSSSSHAEAGLRLTRGGIVMGTPGYMAPEVARGSADVDQRADLFGVAVLAFEMLTRRLPFSGETANELLRATVSQPVPRPRLLNPGISVAMERLVLTGLAKRPMDRFQTAEEFLDHLTAAAVGRIPENARPCLTAVCEPGDAPAGSRDVSRPSLRLRIGFVKTIDTPPLETGGEEPSPERSLDLPLPSPTPGATPARSSPVPLLPLAFALILIVTGAAALLLINLGFFADKEGSAAQDATESRRSIPIWVEVTPLGASLSLDGEIVHARPIMVPQSDTPVTVRLHAPGHSGVAMRIVPDREQTIRAVLPRLERRDSRDASLTDTATD